MESENEVTSEEVITSTMPQRSCSKTRAYITVVVLFFINLLNYMDRFTISAVLTPIQTYFNINDEKSGLLQTVFICSYMILAPIFGYLGDRMRRKYIMAAGILLWSGTVYCSTLVNGNQYWLFLLLRGCVGIGEASYSTIAPTIIADLFVKDQRTKALSFFYTAIPVGSGLGYVVGSQVAKWLGHWQWGLRVTPVLGVVCVFLCVIVVHEPKRGAVEIQPGSEITDISASNVHERRTSWLVDVKEIFSVPTFIWTTLGFTCVTFVTGALAFFAPKFMQYSKAVAEDIPVEGLLEKVAYKFGLITVLAGFIGVWMGAEMARRYRVYNPRADPLVCALGLFLCTPFLYFALILAGSHLVVSWVLICLGEILLCLNWAPVGDIILYVIPSMRRSTAEAVQILASHALGDATSPYIIGIISDAISGSDKSVEAEQVSMEYALLITTFICILGGFCFVMASFYVVKDRERAEKVTKADGSDNVSVLNSVASDDREQLLGDSQVFEGQVDPDPETDLANGEITTIATVHT